MIKKITIKNYQSHKRTTLHLHKGINGIIGRPNSGKTAIIRSLILAKDNRPTGFAYHNNYTKDPKTEVHIKVDNAPLIKFVKTKSKAVYHYGKNIFEKFGKDIPDKVKAGLNLDDINFGLQLGLPFLILSSPSEIARQINDVTESEVISKCIKITNERLNKLKSRKKSLKYDIKDSRSKLLKYKNLNKIEKILKRTRYLDDKIDHLEQSIEDIEDTVEFIDRAEKAIKNQEKPLQAMKLIRKAELIQLKMEKLASQMTLLEKIKHLKGSLKSAIKHKDTLIKEYIKELRENKKCPTCYSPIKLKTVAVIKRELNR